MSATNRAKFQRRSSHCCLAFDISRNLHRHGRRNAVRIEFAVTAAGGSRRPATSRRTTSLFQYTNVCRSRRTQPGANNFTAVRIFSLENRHYQRAATSYFLECPNVRLPCLPLVSGYGPREVDGITVAHHLGTGHLKNSACTLRDTNRRGGKKCQNRTRSHC